MTCSNTSRGRTGRPAARRASTCMIPPVRRPRRDDSVKHLHLHVIVNADLAEAASRVGQGDYDADPSGADATRNERGQLK